MSGPKSSADSDRVTGVAHFSFPRWRASIRALLQGGVWRWALAIGFAVVLGGGAWCYDVLWPRVRDAWPTWKTESAPWIKEILLWAEFLVSIGISTAFLCWATALLFSLLSAAVFLSPRLVGWLGTHYSWRGRLVRMERTLSAIGKRDRLLGTVLNLLASAGALALLSGIRSQPLDVWDFGIQIGVAVAIELIVLRILFAEGRLRRPEPRSHPQDG